MRIGPFWSLYFCSDILQTPRMLRFFRWVPKAQVLSSKEADGQYTQEGCKVKDWLHTLEEGRDNRNLFRSSFYSKLWVLESACKPCRNLLEYVSLKRAGPVNPLWAGSSSCSLMQPHLAAISMLTSSHVVRLDCPCALNVALCCPSCSERSKTDQLQSTLCPAVGQGCI